MPGIERTPLTLSLLLSALLLLAGCTALRGLPDPDFRALHKLQRDSKALTMIGPDGQLSGSLRQRVSARLAELGSDDLLARQLAATEAVSGAPLIAGNAVALLVDGPETYAAIFAAISTAADHVNIESYIFEDAIHDGVSLLALLEQRARAGIRVNLLYDALGSSELEAASIERLQSAGARLCAYNPLNPLDNRSGDFVRRTHRKLVVVDARRAFSGGLNFSAEYDSASSSIIRSGNATLKDGWRDTHIQMDGPAVQVIQKLFLRSWAQQQCPDLLAAEYLRQPEDAGQILLRIDASSPDDDAFATYVAALAGVSFANKSIDLTMAYFAPDDRLQRALIDAAARGVRTRILLPGFSDFSGLLYAGRAHYDALLQAGVEIFEERTAFIHAKTLVVDGIRSTVGSANWDYRSFSYNDELNVVVIDADFGARMAGLFEQDLRTASPLSLQTWRQRPLWQKLAERFWVLWERFL